MKMHRYGIFLAAASLGMSAAEASTGRLMRSPDAHPEPKKLTGAAKAAAEKKARTEAAAAKPKRSAANTATAIPPEQTDEFKRTAAAAPKVDKDGNTWPSWRYGPGGASKVCESAKDVPAGWSDHPSAFEQPEDPALTPLDL